MLDWCLIYDGSLLSRFLHQRFEYEISRAWFGTGTRLQLPARAIAVCLALLDRVLPWQVTTV